MRFKYIRNWISKLAILFFIAIIGYLGYIYVPLAARALFLDTFHIPTGSMMPTLIPGDKVMVNKVVFGSRWYSDIDSVNSRHPDTYRLWSLRGLKHNDIVVFNMPYPYSREKIEFKINYVFCKRCVGLPGDSISIVNGFYKNSNFTDTLGHYKNQKTLSNTPDQYMEYMINTFPYSPSYKWTARHFGPLYIPRRGDTITLDSMNYILYKLPIEFETKQLVTIVNDNVLLGDKLIDSYTFTKNYYFMAGDNVLSSDDSRFWGFVPEEHIVGVVTTILYSKSGEDNWDWSRFCKKP